MTSNDPQGDRSAERIVGRKPTPRVLMISDDDELAEAVEKLVPTFERISSVTEVREQEWDVLVATESISRFSGLNRQYPWNDLYLVTFGAQFLGRAEIDDSLPVEVAFVGSSIAREFIVPELPDRRFQQLVERDLLPTVQRHDEHPVLRAITRGHASNAQMVPLIQTTEGAVLAAVFNRASSVAKAVALPSDVALKSEWVKAALHLFRTIQPDRFQSISDWEDRWLEPPEERIADELTELREAHASHVETFKRREKALTTRLAAAKAEGDDGLRRLLTAQSGELSAVVASVLRTLGCSRSGWKLAAANHGRSVALSVLVEMYDDNHQVGFIVKDALAPDGEMWTESVGEEASPAAFELRQREHRLEAWYVNAFGQQFRTVRTVEFIEGEPIWEFHTDVREGYSDDWRRLY